MRFFEKLVVAYFFGPPCIWHATVKLYGKSTIFHCAQCL